MILENVRKFSLLDELYNNIILNPDDKNTIFKTFIKDFYFILIIGLKTLPFLRSLIAKFI